MNQRVYIIATRPRGRIAPGSREAMARVRIEISWRSCALVAATYRQFGDLGTYCVLVTTNTSPHANDRIRCSSATRCPA